MQVNPQNLVKKVQIVTHMATQRHKSSEAGYFDKLYTLASDPFENENSDYEQAKLAIILDYLKRGTHEFIMDAGCGSGIMTPELAQEAGKTLGIDFSERAIELAKERFAHLDTVAFEVGSLTDYGLPKGSKKLDVIICSEVLYYLRRGSVAEFDQAAENLAQLLALQGRLIVSQMADDTEIMAGLAPHFEILERTENCDWKRPFAVTLLELKS